MTKNKAAIGQPRSTAFIIGVLVIVVAASALAKEFNIIDAAIAKRAVGICFGFIFVVTGNLLPKMTLPLTFQSRAVSRTKSAERFAGRTFVLAGIFYVGIWLVAPPTVAMLFASAIGLGAFLLAGAAWIWLAQGPVLSIQQNTNEDKEISPMNNQSSPTRFLLFAVFHTLLWVFGFFLADSIWGDRISQGMVIPFAVSNTILAVFLLSAISRRQSH